MPSISIAGSMGFGAKGAVSNIEVEGYNAVATVDSMFGKCGRIGGNIISYAMPSVAIAYILSFNSGSTVVDRQVECINIGTDGTRLAVVKGIDA